jgi:hypothetical protein
MSKSASLIAKAKAPAPVPSASMSPEERKAASEELHKRNMAFLAKFLPGISKSLTNYKPKGELVWTEKGDLNVRTGNVFLYKHGAKGDTEAQVNAFQRNPTRVVFAKPEFMFEEVEGASRPDEGKEYAFATQKYDDRNVDAHAEYFVREMGGVMRDKQAKVANVITKKDENYFLIIYGLGLGYQIQPLVEMFNPSVLILLESDLEAFYHSTFTFDWEGFYDQQNDAKKKIRIIFENDATTMMAKLNGAVQGECLLGLDGVISFVHSHSPVLNVVFSEFNSAKTANLASFIGFTVDEFNMMKNSFRNLRPGTKRVLNTVRKKANVPVIIVGSGPSLEDNIEWLKSMQDRAVIISSGSSMAVLLKNGIKPDFQAVLERAKAVYDRHKDAAEQWDLKDTHVVLTTTIWPGIDAFFKDVIYFFRPALSPLGVFCRDNAEILNHEGPQVTNTAFAFARRLSFSEYYLLGIDLGAADPNRPRAEKAWISPGVKQRELTIPVRGNHGRTVFTDRSLTQQRQTIENQIRSIPGGPVYNLGGGVRIAGAEAKFASEVELKELGAEKKELVQQLVDQFPVFDRERFIGAWEASGVRENVAEYITAMIKALNGVEKWDNHLIKKIEDINAYVGKAVRKQYAPRLFRGSVLRICMFVNSIFLRLENREIEKDLFETTRELIIRHLRNLEREAYSLADELEAEDEYFGVKLA